MFDAASDHIYAQGSAMLLIVEPAPNLIFTTECVNVFKGLRASKRAMCATPTSKHQDNDAIEHEAAINSQMLHPKQR